MIVLLISLGSWLSVGSRLKGRVLIVCWKIHEMKV